jgi:hypothetical protein
MVYAIFNFVLKSFSIIKKGFSDDAKPFFVPDTEGSFDFGFRNYDFGNFNISQLIGKTNEAMTSFSFKFFKSKVARSP